MTSAKRKIEPYWSLEEAIAETVDTSISIAQNVVKMLEEGATIPFIARYRKEKTGGMEADKLREINSLLEELKSVISKLNTIFNAIEAMGKMNNLLAESLRAARSLSDLEHLYAPYKPGHKGSLAERARKLGLETPALEILEGKHVRLETCIKTGEKGLSKVEEVEMGVQHILADIISKNKDVMTEARRICECSQVKLESSQSKSSTKKEDSKPVDTSKFENYFEFSVPVKYAKGHQILAINRGEDKKILSVKINVPSFIKDKMVRYCSSRFTKHWSHERIKTLMTRVINDAYDRLIQPHVCRNIRSELTKRAEKDSILVFASNLNRLLLTPCVKGKMILGIDPGFKNGCKVAVISSTGVIKTTQVLYFLDHKSNKAVEKRRFIDLVNTHRCEMIAIGNGVACRQTEEYVTNLIKGRSFSLPEVMYCIVDESGASIYSVSDEAKRELPDLDATLRGAVSIARRLQDPLAELVKIEPKHLGVGMYQHDISESKLKVSLDSVVEECVSFVGVDVNTGSECLLRRIAGLNATKAKKIVEWREKNGAFVNREQLLTIKGLGQKGYEQCAGFIRVMQDSYEEPVKMEADPEADVAASTSTGRKRKAGTARGGAKKKKGEMSCHPNPLDMTSIHPESYHIANRLISDTGVDGANVGQPSFCEAVKLFTKSKSVEELAQTYNTGVPTMSLIVDALQQNHSFDIRDKYDKPLFKKGVMSMEELQTRQVLTGRVTNVTHFGAFVDIGVGQNGLIHTSQMRQGLGGRSGVELGDNVNVEVINVDIPKKRVGLKLIGFVK